MASYSYALGPNVNLGRGISTLPRKVDSITFGRVTDIILDSNHPRYSDLGATLALNGIFYRPLGSPVSEEEELLFFAYAFSKKIAKIPLIGEIVEVFRGPSEEIDGEVVTSTKLYYRDIVDLWNNPHQSSYPDIYQDSSQAQDLELGYGFNERSDIRPLQSYPGDVVIQGRLGQSIRFSGVTHPDNIYTDSSNNGTPFTIIRNNQRDAGEGDTPITEDINRDGSSIYLMSDHSVPLEQGNYKRFSYDDVPDSAHVYKGEQILLNSGRVFINAKDESVLLSARESVGLNGRTVNLDGEDYLAVDASKVYLGEKARTTSNKEPVVLGKQLEAWLNQLLDILDSMQRDFATALTPPQASAALLKQAGSLPGKIINLRTSITNHHSEKVYSE